MRLQQAVEILELNLKEAGKNMPPDCRDAIQLSIEALNRLQINRKHTFIEWVTLLPSETIE